MQDYAREVFWSRPPQPGIWASLEACCLLHRCSCTVLRALRLGQSSLLPLSTLQLHSAACSPLGAIGQLVAHSASCLFQHCGCIVLRALRLGQSSNLFTRRPSDIVPRYSMQFGIEFCFTGVTETHGIACISHEWQVPKDATSFPPSMKKAAVW